MAANGVMPIVTRRGWAAELPDVWRFLAVIIGTLVVFYIGYVVVMVALGTIRSETNTSLAVDTGTLDRGPGTPTAAIVDLLQTHPESVGWAEGQDLTARVDLLDQGDRVACFEIGTGDVHVAEVRRSGGSWALAGLTKNVGPDEWSPVRGSVSSHCLSALAG